MLIADKAKAELEFPSLRFFDSYLNALREGFVRGVDKPKTAEEIFEISKDPEKHLQSLNAPATGVFTTPNGKEFQRVPYEMLWLVNDDVFIGSVSFRHELNEFLENFGGHVGYGIRPSLEGQGYGTLILQLTIQRAAKMGMEKLLLTCSPGNPASRKIILNNGGVYLDTLADSYGYHENVERYKVPVQ